MQHRLRLQPAHDPRAKKSHMIRARISGVGSYLPAKRVTNADLEKIVDTTDDWIVSRTGIKARYIAADGEYTSDLAIKAAQAALAHAGKTAADLDLIIVATTTPDNTFPATAVKVQAALGAHGIPAFDVQAVCSGFIYALSTADNFIRAGQAKCALVIGAETLSRILDWTDRTTCVLFGDGAGAVVLEATTDDTGILSTHLHADGRYADKLYTDGGASTTKTVGLLRMQGQDVYRFAVEKLSSIVDETLAHNNLHASDIKWLVPHQANVRIIESVAKKLNLPLSQVVLTIAEHGNTSAASIPLALDTAVKDGRIQRGDVILMEALGGGFTWGAALVKW